MRIMTVSSLLFISTSLFGHTEDTHSAQKLLITNTSIGEMKITPKMTFSITDLSKYFSGYRITHQIAEGDSPDYHLFSILTNQGETLVSFHSYIENELEYKIDDFELDEIVSCNPNIQDSFGISPGMQINAAISARPTMKFGAGHLDNFLGLDNLWYIFKVEDKHGTMVSKEEAIRANPQIECISWPAPWWY